MSKTIGKPITKGVAKVPVFIQMETMECGAACLGMILAYYGKWVPLSKLRNLCSISRDGARMSTIARTARSQGLKAQGYRYGLEGFFEKATFPCIVHWDFKHFVVVRGRRGNKVYINDPARGAITITLKDFDESYTGVCVCFDKGESFEPSDKPFSVSDYILKNLGHAAPAFAFVLCASIITAMVSAFVPGLSKVLVDRVLTERSVGWLAPTVIIMCLLCLIQLIVGWVQAVHQMKLFGVLAVRGSTRFMWHILKMPSEFFFQRMAADLQQNKESAETVANTFITMIVPMMINGVMMVVYLIFMFQYSLVLSLIGLFFVAINVLHTKYITNRRINLTRVMRRDYAKLMNSSMESVSMLETIKATGAENVFFGRWSGYQANLSNQMTRIDKETYILSNLPESLTKLSSAVILCIGVFFITQGHFTVGMVMAFQSYLNAFLKPAQMMINSGQQIQEMRTDIERIEDVMDYPEYDVFLEDDSPEEEYSEQAYEKLSGSIELSHVTFGYSKVEDPVIKDFSLKVEPGQSIAIVGASGCGKSTILSLISGLYSPWEGQVLFDGKPLSQISKYVFHGSLSMIDQRISLFRDTIANNIRMWDSSIDNFEIIMAANDARIHEEIIKRKKGYNAFISENGNEFSGGQRQRLEIARALVTDPTIVILDEATSALDAATENEVMKSIRERGITSIIVAHRLSTIRDCDKILVLDQGEIVEQGTHQELMAADGHYSALIHSN
ncbi:MAG: NHLP family bacteriocin export ABC transporter peptidase/permease/ATPase subunit [Eubacterium sp.]|nr:NHLP family bacteriocin export ABC transporter peptidase/permease/ATPase subunit [Eubacterium sp.]